MLHRVTSIGALALLLSAAGLRGEDAKKDTDKDKLQGTWEVTEMVAGGNEVPKEQREALKVIFDGDKQILDEKGKKKEFAYKLDPSKKPKWIDLTPKDGPDKDRSVPGIYELDGDVLKLCMQNATDKRPTEFKSTKDSYFLLMTLKRVKK